MNEDDRVTVTCQRTSTEYDNVGVRKECHGAGICKELENIGQYLVTTMVSTLC